MCHRATTLRMWPARRPRQFACCGPLTVAVLEDLEIAAPLIGRRGPPLVVDQQDVDPGELAEDSDVGAVARAGVSS
jgi:hypothetical protein